MLSTIIEGRVLVRGCILAPWVLFFVFALFLSCSNNETGSGGEASNTPTEEDGGGTDQGDGADTSSSSDVNGGVNKDATGDETPQEDLGPAAGPMMLSGSFQLLELPLGSDEFPVYEGNGSNFPDVTAGLFGDLDGDGFPEVIIGILECCDKAKRSRAFRFDPETASLQPAPDLLPSSSAKKMGLISAVVDLNDDGYTDLVTSDFKKIFLDGDWVPSYYTPIWYGKEEGGIEVGGPLDFFNGEERQIRFGGTMDLTDLDSDGWLDLLVSEGDCLEESGPSVHPLLRTGPNAYQLRDSLIEVTPRNGAEALFARPFGPASMMVFSAGHNCTNADPMDGFFIPAGFDSDGYPMFSSSDATPLESLYKEEAAVSYGPITKASPMGSALVDFNHDGMIDLNVSLFWLYAIFQGTDSWPLIDRTAETGQEPHPGIGGGGKNDMIPWGVAPVDLDLDGFTDLVINHGDDDSAWLEDGAWVGLHYTTSLRNLGGFAFEDITQETGLGGDWGSWRSMSVGDLNRDGKMDLVIGGVGYRPRVFLNTLETPHHGFAVQLRGATSNSLGIGAKVAVMTSATPPQLQLMGNVSSPYVTSEPLVFFGTGTAEMIETVRVTWPSGYVQEFHDLPSEGVHVFQEPPLVELEPRTRHLPADGNSLLTIRVRPHDIDGVPMEATVEVDSIHGDAIFDGPVALLEDGSWERRLVAPSQAGSSVIQVTIDGVALTVRPRVWWD